MKLSWLFLPCALLLSSCGQDDKSSAKAANAQAAPNIEVAKVTAQKLSITVHLPGEIEPYEAVAASAASENFAQRSPILDLMFENQSVRADGKRKAGGFAAR